MPETKSLSTMVSELPTKKLGTLSVDLTKYEEAAKNLIAQAERAEITDEDTYATGGDLIVVARNQVKKAEDQRKELTNPVFNLKKFIDGQFKAVKDEFDKARVIIEKKMVAWKKAEDERIRKEAEEAARKLEEEALARAAEEKDEEAQDEVIEAAAEASEELVEKAQVGLKRGNYGSTGTRKAYSTRVDNQLDFLRALIKHIDDGNKRDVDLGSLIEFRKGGLNAFAKRMREAGVKRMPGAEFCEDDKIRVY